MPVASLEDNLPFLLDEDPSRGSSKHGSQAGSSVHGPAAVQQPQQQQPAQEQKSLQQPRRAWSVDPQPGMQVCETLSSVTASGERHAGRLFWLGYSPNAGEALSFQMSARRS